MTVCGTVNFLVFPISFKTEIGLMSTLTSLYETSKDSSRSFAMSHTGHVADVYMVTLSVILLPLILSFSLFILIAFTDGNDKNACSYAPQADNILSFKINSFVSIYMNSRFSTFCTCNQCAVSV